MFTPEKEFIKQLAHYFQIVITPANEKYVTQMLSDYAKKCPPIYVPVPVKFKRDDS
jgi:hypothetical protein